MYPIITHGSKDSLDHDVYVIFDHIPSFKEAKSYCQSLTGMNPNILVIQDGVVSWSFKGTEDECNNSLFYTYHLHEQDQEIPVTRIVERDLDLKLVRTVRGLLSYFSRTDKRIEVKKALRSPSWAEKYSILKDLQLSRNIDYVKCNHEELFKFFAFQIGQTLSLIKDGEELFTKRSIADKYPELEDFLYRKFDSDESILQEIYIDFISLIEKEISETTTHRYLSNFSGQEFTFKEVSKF